MTTARSLRGPFDYHLPEELRAAVQIGSMLVVPFGRRQVLRPEVVDLNTIVAELETLLHRLIGPDIDMAANLKRTMFNFAAHRRPEHYRLIVERVGAEVTPAKEGT